MSRRILVTGGCGYIGSALVPRLTAAEWQVTVLDLMLYGDAGLHDLPGVELHIGDVRDRARLVELVPGHDAILHLAFVSNDPGRELPHAIGESINRNGFSNVLAAARDAGVARFVFASSCSVYGARGQQRCDEATPPDPLTQYARDKLACERLMFADGGAMAVTAVRAATVSGPAPRLRLDLVVNRMTATAYYENEVVIADPETVRASVHVDDLAAVYAALLDRPPEQIAGRVVNVAAGSWRLGDLAVDIAARAGARWRCSGGSIDRRSYAVACTELVRLGIAVTRTPLDAASELMDRFAAGVYPGAPHDDRYHNVRVERRRWGHA
ncbi:MAG: SDR family oxidoreductase [Kofleriaceae bacterium]